MDITIAAPKMGKLNGTSGWVLDYLSNVELSFKTLSDDGIGLFERRQGFNKEGKAFGWDLVCFYNPAWRIKNGEYEEYMPCADNIWAVYPSDTGDQCEKTMFSVLTPAATRIASAFVSACVVLLSDTITGEGADVEATLSVQFAPSEAEEQLPD
jgi:hypothetical protein